MNKKQNGFTLVELTLAMAFVAVLLMAIVVLTMQIVNIYTRGVTLRSVDRSGQVIVTELQRAINQATSDSEKGFIYAPKNDGAKVVAARLCTGKVSYAWNTIDYFRNTGTSAGVNRYTSGPNEKDIRFIRVSDEGSRLCDWTANIERSKATELLAAGDRTVVIHNFSVAAEPMIDSQKLITATFTLGTQDGADYNTNALTGTSECKPPADNRTDFCAINVFTFTARAGNLMGEV
jgi:prepilin-type N-terminal cleavage/methylation domain-containing protein